MQLIRGQRLTELLKQGLTSPMDVVDQVVAIFAGSSGVLDEIPNEKVQDYEVGMLAFVKDKYPDTIESIRTTKQMSKEVEETLLKAYREYLAEFKKQHNLE
jgi:F-type H+-transporting ATPase subunit alpha